MSHVPPSLMATSQCHGFGNNQLMRLNAKGQLGVGERCVEADSQGIKLAFCRLGTVDGPWQYDEVIFSLIYFLIFITPEELEYNCLLCTITENEDSVTQSTQKVHGTSSPNSSTVFDALRSKQHISTVDFSPDSSTLVNFQFHCDWTKST